MQNNLFNILKKELRELFRDKKSLVMMLVIPIFIPLLVIGMSALFDMQANKNIEDFNKIGFAYQLSEEEKEIAENMDIKITYGTEDELKQKYENSEINLYVTKENNNYILNTGSNDNDSYAINLMQTYFDSLKQYMQANYLSNNNINPNEVLNIINVE